MPATRSLAGKVLAIVLLALAAAAGVVWYLHDRAVANHLQRDRQAAAVTALLLQARMRELQLRAHALATDPAFVDYVAQSLIPNPQMGGSIDSVSINNLLDERRKGYDTAVVLNANGAMVTRSGIQLHGAGDFRKDRLVRRVLRTRKPASGLWSGQDQLARVAVEPLLRGSVLKGVLIAATRVQPSLLRDTAGITHRHAAFVVSDGKRAAVPLSTGMGPATLSALANSRPDVVDAVGDAHPARLPLDAGTGLAWVQPISSSDGHAALVLMGPHARLESLAIPADAVPLLAAIAVLAALGLGLALLAHRRRDRPLDDMHRILERAANGENAITLRTGGNADVRRLRDVINGVLSRLP